MTEYTYSPTNIALGGLQGQSGSGIGQNWGYSSGAGAGSASGWSQSNSYGVSDSWSNYDAWSAGDSWQQGMSDSRTFGREASAQDILNAAEANALSLDMWALNAAYNAREAEKNRQYQEYMSNTSYQRAVQDLKKAGLNPILAAGNMGASTPGGGQASSGQAVSHKANAYAEQQSSSRSAGASTQRSGATGRSGSHSEQWSNSYGWNQSNNWQTSSSAQYGYNVSQYTNNVREIAQTGIEALNNAFNGAGTAASQYFNSRDARGNRYAAAEWLLRRKGGTSSSGRSGKY